MYSNIPCNTHSEYSEVRTAPFELGQSLKDVGEGIANGQKEANARDHDIQTSSTSDNQANTSSGDGSGYGSGSYGQNGYGS